MQGETVRDEFRRDWWAFCDADPVAPDFTERMEAAGLIEIRKVKKVDVERDPFAADRGIEMGGWIWVPTDAGRRALAEAEKGERDG